MKLPNIQIALFGLMQSFTQTSDNDALEYIHWDGTRHILSWLDVVQTIEGVVQEAEQLDRQRLKMAQHAENYGMSRPDFDTTQWISVGNRVGFKTMKETLDLQAKTIGILNQSIDLLRQKIKDKDRIIEGLLTAVECGAKETYYERGQPAQPTGSDRPLQAEGIESPSPSQPLSETNPSDAVAAVSHADGAAPASVLADVVGDGGGFAYVRNCA